MYETLVREFKSEGIDIEAIRARPRWNFAEASRRLQPVVNKVLMSRVTKQPKKVASKRPAPQKRSTTKK